MEKISKEFKHNELVTELEVGLKHHFEGQQVNPIKVALLSKYLKTVKATILLDDNGYFEDSQSLIRTLYELMIVLLYCEYYNLYHRYSMFSFVIRSKYLKIIKDQKISHNKEDEEQIIKGVEEFYSIYKPNTKDERKYWNGKNFYESVKDVSEKYKLKLIMIMHDALYRTSSGNIHSDSVTTLKYIEYDPSDNNIIFFKPDAFADNDNLHTYEQIKRINEILLAIFGSEEE